MIRRSSRAKSFSHARTGSLSAAVRKKRAGSGRESGTGAVYHL